MPTDYDWEALWEYAEPDFVNADIIGQPADAACAFARADIATVHAALYHDNGDGADMYALVELRDGRWAGLTSWHDYTGWD